MVPSGYVGALQCDPVEKKPFFHVLPGATALTFGMLGCDLHCAYCQNWITSQALRDPAAGAAPAEVRPEQLAQLAAQQGARIIASSYNEPLITAEWAHEVFRLARPLGLRTAFVSNGNATPEVLDYLRPLVDCYKVDLKSMRDRAYRQLGGMLRNILDTLTQLVALGFWVEVVTLVIPDFNDSPAELHDAARFLAQLSPDIPWHLTAFHADYKMRAASDTTAEMLAAACEIGRAAGLRYVYAGNLPGQTGRWEHTYCPHCDELLIERRGFLVLRNTLAGNGCPRCGTAIAGVWEAPGSGLAA